MGTSGDEPRVAEHRGGGAEGWGRATWKAAVILVAAVVGFMIVPDRLVAYLSLHVAPRVRDAIVALWVSVAFLALCWVFVALQRKRAT